jgi:hypothetical protein
MQDRKVIVHIKFAYEVKQHFSYDIMSSSEASSMLDHIKKEKINVLGINHEKILNSIEILEDDKVKAYMTLFESSPLNSDIDFFKIIKEYDEECLVYMNYMVKVTSLSNYFRIIQHSPDIASKMSMIRDKNQVQRFKEYGRETLLLKNYNLSFPVDTSIKHDLLPPGKEVFITFEYKTIKSSMKMERLTYNLLTTFLFDSIQCMFQVQQYCISGKEIIGCLSCDETVDTLNEEKDGLLFLLRLALPFSPLTPHFTLHNFRNVDHLKRITESYSSEEEEDFLTIHSRATEDFAYLPKLPLPSSEIKGFPPLQFPRFDSESVTFPLPQLPHHENKQRFDPESVVFPLSHHKNKSKREFQSEGGAAQSKNIVRGLPNNLKDVYRQAMRQFQ